ncbi:MAG: hypothetical protein KAX78_08775, partial [Phycisphaerae bacterium]|nr:hypothetical protein [Phycisphaerae bacterium]
RRLFAWGLRPDLSILMICPVCTERLQLDRKMLGWKLRRLRPKEVLPSGVPVYDWADLEEVAERQVPSFAGGDGWKDGYNAYLHTLARRNGIICSLAEPITRARLDLTGVGFWPRRNWRLTPMAFDPETGGALWLKLGRRAPGLAKPGEMYHPRPIVAAIDGFLFVPDTRAQMWVWTDKGLYVGKLYHDVLENIRDADSIFIELVGAYAYRIDGKIYACTGDHGVSVHEVELPKLVLVEIKGRSITVTEEMSKAVKPWDPDGPQPGEKPIYEARSIYDFRNKKQLRTINVDGKLDREEWQGGGAMEISMDNKKVAQVAAVFDQENVYLSYEVKDPHGLRNVGTELPYCPFVSGSYVNFCLGPDWAQPNRESVREGDVRIILARVTGQ